MNAGDVRLRVFLCVCDRSRAVKDRRNDMGGPVSNDAAFAVSRRSIVQVVDLCVCNSRIDQVKLKESFNLLNVSEREVVVQFPVLRCIIRPHTDWAAERKKKTDDTVHYCQ
jgi:hypothetical protein